MSMVWTMLLLSFLCVLSISNDTLLSDGKYMLDHLSKSKNISEMHGENYRKQAIVACFLIYSKLNTSSHAKLPDAS